MSYEVLIEDKPRRKINKLEQKDRERVLKALSKLSGLYAVRLDIIKLAGYKRKYRYRMGDYRALFEVKEGQVRVFDFFPRGKGYKRHLA
jgi:mRNA interferase RelE/StbE